MRLPRFLAKRIAQPAARLTISSCASCPFARVGFCLHPMDRRINLNGIETLTQVHSDCPLRDSPLLLQLRSDNDSG